MKKLFVILIVACLASVEGRAQETPGSKYYPLYSNPSNYVGASDTASMLNAYRLWLRDMQPALVSGTTIKTVNGSSLLGSGNIVIGGSAAWGSITGTLSEQGDLNTALSGKANSSHSHAISDVTNLQTSLDAKQATLVSATNIKTINGASVLGSGDLTVSGSDSRLIVKALTSDAASNSTTTPTEVTSLSQTLAAGTYVFKYYVRYQAGATTTGVRFGVNFTGTTSTFVWNTRYLDATATAATAAPDQDQIIAASGVLGGFAHRTVKTTANTGTTLSVDAANSDMLMIIEGVFIATGSGDLELWHGSEVAAASTVKAGTSLVITKTN